MLTNLKNQIQLLRNDEEGQSLVEYGLLLFLIAVVCITALTNLGTAVEGVFNTIVGKL